MSPPTPEFDPYALLTALEHHRVNYVITGAFARIIHGTPETTNHLDITPKTRPDHLQRLNNALTQLNATNPNGKPFTIKDTLPNKPVIELTTNAGHLNLIPNPTGTPNGYDHLRRQATRENIGQGLKPQTASIPDLTLTLTTLQRDGDERTIQQLHRLHQHDRGRAINR